MIISDSYQKKVPIRDVVDFPLEKFIGPMNPSDLTHVSQLILSAEGLDDLELAALHREQEIFLTQLLNDTLDSHATINLASIPKIEPDRSLDAPAGLFILTPEGLLGRLISGNPWVSTYGLRAT